ncbi:putative reverse transcriptase domain-containing protein [Tanacetum coccineum]
MDSVKIWWDEKNCEKGEDCIGPCSWKEFMEMFSAKYALVEEIDKIREEFHNVVQTNETVNELWKMFNDMVQYFLEYRGNEKLKVDKFQRMLKDDIREMISPFKCTTLEDLLGRARIREVDLMRHKNNEKKDLKRKQDQRHKLNECLKAKAIEATPLRSIKEEKVNAPKAKARTYNITAEEEKLIPDVVTCIILINSLLVRVLSRIADSKVLSVTNVYRDVDKKIDNGVFKIDLIPMMPGEFDIVIGMDCLGKYNATIICSQKIIWVVNPNEREIILYGEKRKGELVLCSVMKASKYTTCCCHAFLAHVIDTSFEKNKIENVPVVNEFGYVFLEDLLGIPPERQVEFRIDLISGATPISKTPYV